VLNAHVQDVYLWCLGFEDENQWNMLNAHVQDIFLQRRVGFEYQVVLDILVDIDTESGPF
jgi:hypothetical protein